MAAIIRVASSWKSPFENSVAAAMMRKRVSSALPAGWLSAWMMRFSPNSSPAALKASLIPPVKSARQSPWA